VDNLFYENKSFEQFYEDNKKYYTEKVDLFLTDPPYNVLQEERKITNEQMELLVKMAESFLKKGGTLLIFCSLDQIPIYRKCFIERKTLTLEPLILNIINDCGCKFYYFILSF
jgi:DNA modification methylase